MRERKSGVNSIKLVVFRISSVFSKLKSGKSPKMEGRKNYVACTIARVISNQEYFQQKSGSNGKNSE